MSVSAMRRFSSTKDAPLTFQQEFFWDFFGLAAGESPPMTFAVRLHGALNVDLLSTCFNQIVCRHDALRTRFVLLNGLRRQCVEDATGWELKVLNFGGGRGGEARARDFLVEFCSRNCDLGAGPLFQAKLIRLSADDHVLVWSIHHIISDVSTLATLQREIWQLYADGLRGRAASIGNPPMRYIDYAIHQRETADEWSQQHQGYWMDRVPRFTCARWPSESGVVRSGTRMVSYEVAFPFGLRSELRRLAQWARTTLSNTLLTIYTAAIASWCDQRAITVPVNVSGRHAPTYERIVGYFAHFLYVHIELSAHETFGGLLSKVSSEMCEALTHQDFGRISANAPEVLTGAMFSWMPYAEGDWLALPKLLSAEIGINGHVFPFQPPAYDFFKLHGIGAIFFEADRDFVAKLWYPNTVSISNVESFALHLRSMAQRAVSNPNAPLF